uniref:Dehydrogenase/reductase SDR family member 4 n=1 Tax=Parastrongyloides trichosuri TaxID=131310 RepID=A0A0N4ZHE2_PARTI
MLKFMSGVEIFQERIALVNGTSKLLGFAIAKKLGRLGATIIVTGRTDDEIQKTVTDLRNVGIYAGGIKCHLDLENERNKLIKMIKEKYGKLDILINNVFTDDKYGQSFQAEPNEWSTVLDVGIDSYERLSRGLAPQLAKASNKGSIVFVSSIGGYAPYDGIGTYSNIRENIITTNKNIANDLASMNIRSNAIATGLIPTDIPEFLLKEGETRDSKVLFSINKPDMVKEGAELSCVICSDDVSYVTGQCLNICGGVHGHLY